MHAELLRIEYDIQHLLILSKRNLRDHLVIRMIVATLSTSEELSNLRKKDFRKFKGKEYEFYTVRLKSAGKTRISPVDNKTYEIAIKLNDFNFTENEIDSIIGKYSPKDKRYDAEKLRKAVIKILKDASLFEIDFEEIRDIETLYMYMIDFNPLYSGIWDEDEECIEDFILNYSEITGIKDASKIATEIGYDFKKVEEILKSGKKSLFSYRIFKKD